MAGSADESSSKLSLHPKARALVQRLAKNPKVRDPHKLAGYIIRRAAASKGGPKHEGLNLAEAIEVMRVLQEVAVGDYVTAQDGTAGYVDDVRGDKVSYTYTSHNSGYREWRSAKSLRVNPGGPPQ